MSRRTSHRLVSVGVVVALAALWQLASILIPYESVPGEPMVPGWQIVVTRTFLDLADYWQGGLGVPSVSQGGPRTYAGAALAVLGNSWDTSLRLFAGLTLGAFVGLISGLAVSWSKWSRRFVALPGQVLRTFPMMALIPMFQLWFGATYLGMMLFVAFAVGVIFFTGHGERRRQRLRHLRRLRPHARSEPFSDLSLGHSPGDVSRTALEHSAQSRHGLDGGGRRRVPRSTDGARTDHRLFPVLRICGSDVCGGALSAFLCGDHICVV